MPRKKKFQHPFLQLSMSTRGVNLLHLLAQDGPTTKRFSQQFDADVHLDPHGNRAAIALTLVEVAEHIVRGLDLHVDESLSEACRALYLVLVADPEAFAVTPRHERDDLPF